jgi:hypothetical protein
MKKLIFTILTLLTLTFAIAQDGINYQGAATDVNGDELTNQNITIRASVLSATANGNLEWEEIHSSTTDQFGLFNVVIGQGTNTTNGAIASFDDMDWGSGNHFLKIEMDATGGTNYAMIGTTQMMSVPYALYAKSAGIDSTMLANMIGSSGGGMGGGCDLNYPEGIGESVLFDIGPWSSGVNYTVPSNKNLYITSFMSSYADAELQISTHTVYKGQGNRVPQTSSPRYGAPHLPIIASSSEVISSTHDYIISGFLVDKLVEPITIDLSANYTVPQGKKLIVLNFYTHQSSSLTVNSKILLSGYYNYFSNITGCNPPCHSSSLKMPIFLSGNMIISSSPGEVINGYLVDENYFAGCGGGGSSSGSSASNATIDSLSQVVSNLDSSLTALTSQFNFGCNDPTACNYDATANFNDGSCILPDGCTDPNAINYDATAICDDGSCVTAIGQYYQGGIIAYIDGTGLHGLIVSPDIGNASWGCYGTNLPGADGTAIGTGNQNTIDIINGCPSTTAASLCGDLVLNGYSDWHLPSKDELYQLYLNSVAAGIPSTAVHFSSSEGDATGAWLQSFSNGSQQNGSKVNVYPVIAVRQF